MKNLGCIRGSTCPFLVKFGKNFYKVLTQHSQKLMRLLLQNFWCCYDSAIGRRIGVATTTAEEQVIRHIIKTKDVQKYQNWELATCKQRRPIAF